MSMRRPMRRRALSALLARLRPRCCPPATARRRHISRRIATRKPEPEQAAVANMQMAHRVHAAQQAGAAPASASSARSTRLPQNAERAGDRGSGVRAAQRNGQGAARLLGRRASGQEGSGYSEQLCGLSVPHGQDGRRRETVHRGGARTRCIRLRRWRWSTPAYAWAARAMCVDAERYFNRALAIRPNMPEALLQLGNLAFDRGDATQALDIVQRYLAVNPPTPEVLWLGLSCANASSATTPPRRFMRRRVQTEFPDSAQAQDDARRRRSMSEARASARTAAQGGARTARDERAEGRRRNASRRVGDRCARGRRLPAHRPDGVRQGHLKKYASMLGLPPAEIAADFDAAAGGADGDSPSAQPLHIERREPRRRQAANLPWPQIGGRGGCRAGRRRRCLWWQPWRRPRRPARRRRCAKQPAGERRLRATARGQRGRGGRGCTGRGADRAAAAPRRRRR